MDYAKTAKDVLTHVGGKKNIVSLTHCVTRLRLVILDDAKCDKNAIEQIQEVKGVYSAKGQIQIIFGAGIVDKVYDEFVKLTNSKEETVARLGRDDYLRRGWLIRGTKIMGDIFIPIIPAIVACGLLKGLINGLGKAIPVFAESDIWAMLSIFSGAAFVFLPILIAISAARVFGANMYLGTVMGMIMIHPDLTNAWNAQQAIADGTMKTFSIFGLYEVNQVGYQGHVIPVILAVFLLSVIEKKMHKIVPNMIELFVTPLVSVLVSGFVAIAVIGPIFGKVETWAVDRIEYLITLPYGIGAIIIGGLYAVTVVTGLHHMYSTIEVGMLSAVGKNSWMPIATAANVAQGAAAMAVAVRTKNKKMKTLAITASMSALLGITEPAIFGVNLRYRRPFVAALIGGAVGSFVAYLFGVYATAYGITGLFGCLITMETLLGYILTMAAAYFSTFVIVLITGINEDNIE